MQQRITALVRIVTPLHQIACHEPWFHAKKWNPARMRRIGAIPDPQKDSTEEFRCLVLKSGMAEYRELSRVLSLCAVFCPVMKETNIMFIDEEEMAGFSMLEMKVMDDEDLFKVIFMGRWLVNCVSEPSVTHPEMNRYTVAYTPTDSYFVFWEPLDLPALRRYEMYDCFAGMEESLEVPESILKAISTAHPTGPDEDCGILDT